MYRCNVCGREHGTFADAAYCCFNPTPKPMWGCQVCGKPYDHRYDAVMCCADKRVEEEIMYRRTMEISDDPLLELQIEGAQLLAFEERDEHKAEEERRARLNEIYSSAWRSIQYVWGFTDSQMEALGTRIVLDARLDACGGCDILDIFFDTQYICTLFRACDGAWCDIPEREEIVKWIARHARTEAENDGLPF